MRRASSYLKEINVAPIDIIKIDTEGAEFRIIRALDREMVRKTTWITGELHGVQDFQLLDYLSHWFDIGLCKRYDRRTFMFHACKRRLDP